MLDDAEVALAKAHASDADRLDPYDLTAADLYLAKAREEQGHAHYAAAIELGQKALSHAEAAVRRPAEPRKPNVPAPRPTTDEAGK